MANVNMSADLATYLQHPQTWTDQCNMHYKEIDVQSSSDEFKALATHFVSTIASYHKNSPMNHKVYFQAM